LARQIRKGQGSQFEISEKKMTLDEKQLLKRGAFWATMIAGFLWLISLIHNRFAVVAVMVIWGICAYAIFYRDAHQSKSHLPANREKDN
jgi:hypothetical protein